MSGKKLIEPAHVVDGSPCWCGISAEARTGRTKFRYHRSLASMLREARRDGIERARFVLDAAAKEAARA